MVNMPLLFFYDYCLRLNIIIYFSVLFLLSLADDNKTGTVKINIRRNNINRLVIVLAP
jgi:hypothetical protein